MREHGSRASAVKSVVIAGLQAARWRKAREAMAYIPAYLFGLWKKMRPRPLVKTAKCWQCQGQEVAWMWDGRAGVYSHYLLRAGSLSYTHTTTWESIKG